MIRFNPLVELLYVFVQDRQGRRRPQHFRFDHYFTHVYFLSDSLWRSCRSQEEVFDRLANSLYQREVARQRSQRKIQNAETEGRKDGHA